ncbi:MAG TPA: bifunctional glycosyltransferase/class I SAM-dependent methyltransferase [Acidimicrobiales bacterium]
MMVRKKAAPAASARRKKADFRVGIILVAYNAERTINAVLDRIPETFWDRCAGVWLSDDGSGDTTHKMAVEWRQLHPQLPLTIVRQPVNLGYGGNQKAGYHWAIDNELDCVVLLHGDGQYAPEIIEDIIAPIERGEAKAVLGSRMLTRGGARRGGMPLYKFVGNRILTTFQNWITGIHLAEWHSGYRAYAVDVLKKIDFNGNSDGFDFDTEILLQVLSAGGHIGEVPIPTYYGEEVSYVNGMKYAKDVVIDSIAWRLQKKGFGAGHLASVGTDYAMRDAATSSHQAIISRLSHEGPSRILDVGCAAGWTSEILADRHTVVGVDQFAHPGVTDRMSEFIKADLGKGLPSKVGSGYDVVVAADVLEHLATPEHLLAQFKDVLNPDGFMLVSVPNVGHWYPRLRSLIGTFEYDQRGILDSTHLRFYNRRSFRRLLRIGGYHLKVETPLGFPAEALGPGMRDDPPLVVRLIQAFEKVGLKLYPTLFAYQFLCELVPPVRSEVVTVVSGTEVVLAGSTELNPDSFGAGGDLPAGNGAAAPVPLDADDADDHQRNNGDGGSEVKVRRPKTKNNV